MAYQRVVDNMTDKSQTLAQTSADPQVTSKLTLIVSRYQQLCKNAKVNSPIITFYLNGRQKIFVAEWLESFVYHKFLPEFNS